MEGNQVILKGEKGLYLTDGNKIYFPDRSFKDARMGFVKNVKVVKDKGTYAFITGEMVENTTMDMKKFAKELIKEKGVLSTYVDSNRSMFYCHWDGNTVVTVGNKFKGVFDIYIGGELFMSSCLKCIRDWLFWISNIYDTTYLEVENWLEESSMPEEATMLCMLNSVYRTSSGFRVWGNNVAVSPINSDGLVIKCGFNGSISDRKYLSQDSITRLVNEHQNYRLISEEDLKAFARERFISMQSTGVTGVEEFTFRFMNSSCTVKLFTANVTWGKLQDSELVKEVNESIENFNKWLVWCGKYVNGRNAQEFSSLKSRWNEITQWN